MDATIGRGFPKEYKTVAEFTIASATTTNLGITEYEHIFITGTIPINRLGNVSAGVTKWCRFAEALTLIQHSEYLILPSTANIVTAANDCFKFLSLGSGNWICTGYKLQSGKAIVGFNSGTVIATTSGTSHTFSGLPAGVKLIHLSLSAVSTSGVAGFAVQIGDSGGLETIGYNSMSGGVTRTDSFVLTAAIVAADVYDGVITLALVDSATNSWVERGSISSGATAHHSNGRKSLSGTLDRIALTSLGDTFDAGNINILYQ